LSLSRGNRASIASNAILASIRASGAPMQKWDSLAEGDVFVGIARDVELFRIFELSRIAIRRSDDHQREGARGNLGSSELHGSLMNRTVDCTGPS